jgi:hypothetical protein
MNQRRKRKGGEEKKEGMELDLQDQREVAAERWSAALDDVKAGTTAPALLCSASPRRADAEDREHCILDAAAERSWITAASTTTPPPRKHRVASHRAERWCATPRRNCVVPGTTTTSTTARTGGGGGGTKPEIDTYIVRPQDEPRPPSCTAPHQTATATTSPCSA